MNNCLPNQRQRGAALLLMMLAVLVSMSAILLSRLNTNTLRPRQISDTQLALAQARNALIDYATVYPDLVPGEPVKLPCPDIDDAGGTIDGEAHTTACGGSGINAIGRLPWRTLGTDAIRDSSGACLWYVVSGSYKDAAGSTSPMINPDTNGQLQLYGLEQGTIFQGAVPEDRPVAMIIAAMRPVNGQTRSAASGPDRQCSDSFLAPAFLDSDSGSGISNAVLGGSADTLDQFVVASGRNEFHNDLIATITRADLARATAARQDYVSNMRELGLAITGCFANYARGNSGGVGDRRLPWPALVGLADYRPDAQYDDRDAGVLSGRLPDIVDDSAAVTGNSITQVLTACDSSVVPDWSAEMLSKWRNWKDHYFYVVAESFGPNAPLPSTCSNCLTVNGSGQYAAIILFANSRLSALGQIRNAPPIDADTKNQLGNYLEDSNVTSLPYVAGTADFSSQPSGSNFNDMAFCIDDALNISEC